MRTIIIIREKKIERAPRVAPEERGESSERDISCVCKIHTMCTKVTRTYNNDNTIFIVKKIILKSLVFYNE